MVQLANSNGCSVFEILTLHVSYTYLQNEVLYLIIFPSNLVLVSAPAPASVPVSPPVLLFSDLEYTVDKFFCEPPTHVIVPLVKLQQKLYNSYQASVIVSAYYSFVSNYNLWN